MSALLATEAVSEEDDGQGKKRSADESITEDVGQGKKRSADESITEDVGQGKKRSADESITEDVGQGKKRSADESITEDSERPRTAPRASDGEAECNDCPAALLQACEHRFSISPGFAGSRACDVGTHLVVKVLSDPEGVHFSGVGAKLWAASRVLAQLLLKPEPLGPAWSKLLGATEPLRVVELGAGTALPSICLACVGHKVVATDLAEIVPVTRANLSANHEMMTGQAEATPLEFGDESSARGLGEIDLLLGADIAYDPVNFDPLLRTLGALQGSWKALLAISDRSEDLGEETFENHCSDEGVRLLQRYTACLAGAPRVNVYELDAAGIRADSDSARAEPEAREV